MPEEVKSDEAPPSRWRRIKRWLIGLGITFGVLTLLGGLGLDYAEHRTSQPSFCASCHNMVPYYETWQADLHGGKLDVACVECHYAPGERTTLKAKFRGLSQVASYFSGRYGATRPRAHVSNDSCLTSKCHGDLKFMDKPIQLGTVAFTHAKHLARSKEQEQPNEARLVEIETSLKGLVGEERFKELETVAGGAGPADDRYDRLAGLPREWSVPVDRELLIEFSQLHHRKVRIAQLHDLQCANCHAYHTGSARAAPGQESHHFSVHTTTCFTCHFNNEGFNTGTNRCLLCHSLPVKDVLVHPQESERRELPELARQPVKMNHQSILERKVGCIACHADVAFEQSQVTRRDCERCHDQPRFFADWKEPVTLDVVAHYHAIHVPEQRAKCLDCHSEIHHQLLPTDPATGHPVFLASVMANCTNCHPNQHVEQVSLLSGVGGTGVTEGTPNMMFGSRTNCYGCHLKSALDEHGGAVFKGTLSGCIACHGDRHTDTFEKWKLGLEFSQTDADEAYANARQMLEEATDASDDARRKATDLLTAAEADLRLIKRGNGLHNVMYSMELLESVARRSREAMAALSEQQ